MVYSDCAEYKKVQRVSQDMRLPLAAIERIMRHAGAENTSADAVELLRESTQELADELAEDAVRIAQQNGRQRIEIDDIEEAIEA